MSKVRSADHADAALLGRLFWEFNTEFGYDEPPAADVAVRVAEQLAAGQIAAVVAEPDHGFAQVRWRSTLYSPAPAACLEELWVRPAARGRGLGRALLEAAMDLARAHGCDHIDLNTSATDVAAQALYRSAGFTDLEGGDPRATMLYFERSL